MFLPAFVTVQNRMEPFLREQDHPGEAYEFDVRLGDFKAPRWVQEQLAPRQIKGTAEDLLGQRLRAFAEAQKKTYPWISYWAQAAQPPEWLAWLVLGTKQPVMEDLDRAEELDRTRKLDKAEAEAARRAIARANRRFWDLDSIKDRLAEELQTTRWDVEHDAFWEDIGLRPLGRKDWDPRHSKMSGRKEWDPRPKKPVVVLVDEMEKRPEGRHYAATIYRWDPEEFEDLDAFLESGDRDDYHLDRTDYYESAHYAQREGEELAARSGYKVMFSIRLY